MGRPIRVGDTLVYARRKGSQLWLAKMQVHSIGDQIVGYTEAGRRLTLYNPETTIVVKKG